MAAGVARGGKGGRDPLILSLRMLEGVMGSRDRADVGLLCKGRHGQARNGCFIPTWLHASEEVLLLAIIAQISWPVAALTCSCPSSRVAANTKPCCHPGSC